MAVERHQVQKAGCWKLFLNGAQQWDQKQADIQAAANQARAEAAKEQHEVSKPWTGEQKMVSPQNVAGPPSIPNRDYSAETQRKTSTAVAAASKTGRRAVEQFAYIEKHAPELVPGIGPGPCPRGPDSPQRSPRVTPPKMKKACIAASL